MMYSKLNRLYGSKKQYEKLVDISLDEIKLRTYYDQMHSKMKKYLFYNYLNFESFRDLIQSMKKYSPSSGVYIHENEKGEMLAGSTAMNWGEFLTFQIVNPKVLATDPEIWYNEAFLQTWWRCWET